MDSRTLLAVVLALAVGLHAVGGAALADSSIDVSLSDAAATDSGTVTKTLTYTFTASSNQSVTANTGENYDGGNVVFQFAKWENLTTGQTGTTSTWTLRNGHQYRVTFEVTVDEDATTQLYSADVFDSGPFGQVEVDVVEPEFGYVSAQYTDLVFESQDQATTTKSVDISNTGDGVMRPTDVTFDSVPSGFEVEASGLPNKIGPGESVAVDLEITADPSVSADYYEFDATVTDNLGNTRTFTVGVTVSKPPVLGVRNDNDTVNVGDVLAGSEKTVEFEIHEEVGYSGIDGVTLENVGSGQFGSISFGGLSYVNTDPGGSDTADVTVSVGENAPQHSELTWTANLTPDDSNGVGKDVTFVGRTIYPAEFGTVSLSGTSMTFDEPKSQVSVHTETVELSVPNEGDLDMNVQDVSVTTDSSQVTASVVDPPSTIDGLSTETIEVEVEADPDAPEGTYSLSATVDTEDAGQQTVSSQVEISHGVELSVARNSIAYGDVIVTKNLTESIDVAEALEYEDVTGVTVTKVSGPDAWLTVVERPPERLTAGDAAPLVVALQFDTSAELYREYTWKFEVSGENVAAETITVTATPKPYSFDQIRDPLDEYTGTGDWRGETASGMVTTFDTLETELRDGGNVPESDLSTALAAGRATLLFVESVQEAKQTLASEGNEAGQDEVVRAAAAYNLLDSYVSNLENQQLRSSAGKSRETARQTVTDLIERQRDYYQSRLDSDDLSLIERAQAKRQLAQLASLQGDDERAKRLREESATAFDEYSAAVATGAQKRQQARNRREEMEQSMFTVVAGQPLVLNPVNWDAFDQQSATALSAYDDSAASFETAGATEEAERVRTERRQAASELQFARYSLYGATAVYALVFLGLLGYLVRNTYAYVRDARAAVTGDFLVEA